MPDNLTPETLQAFAEHMRRQKEWPGYSGVETVTAHASAWEAQLAADRKRLEAARWLLDNVEQIADDFAIDEPDLIWNQRLAAWLADLAAGEET